MLVGRHAQVFLKVDKPEQQKLSQHAATMEAVRKLLGASRDGEGGGGVGQRSDVMALYNLTAEVKVITITNYV